MTSINIRPATAEDAALILSFITDLAIYEEAEHEVIATESDIRESLFANDSKTKAVICHADDEPVGFAKKREKAFLHMVKSWHQGNLDGLEELVETFKTYPLYYKNLLVKRNINWVPQIEKFLTEEKNVLVIVGAAHLPGEDGLLNLLTEKGYELERVSYVMP